MPKNHVESAMWYLRQSLGENITTVGRFQLFLQLLLFLLGIYFDFRVKMLAGTRFHKSYNNMHNV